MAALSLYEIKIDNNNDAVEDAIKLAAALKMPTRYCSWRLLTRTVAGCFEPFPDFAEVTSCQCRPDSQELFRSARCH